MFENLLFQDEAARQLTADTQGGRLPPTLLFAGPQASGKLTAALELARVLSCSLSGESDCQCPSCARHASLSHPDLLLSGPRSFPEEIPAAMAWFQACLSGSSAGRIPEAAHGLLRSVRKLLRRFDTTLYVGEESKLAKATSMIREVEELLQESGIASTTIHSHTASLRSTEKGLATILDDCMRLEASVPETVPVSVIRNIESWARIAPTGRRKTVVIENADRMQDSSRNALLKILEEPPETVRFVLVTFRQAAMLATILSRSRTYHFRARTASESIRILERVFGASGGHDSIESYLAARRRFTPEAAQSLAKAFIAASLRSLLAKRSLDPALEQLAREGERTAPDQVLDGILEATGEFGAKNEAFAGSFAAFLAACMQQLGSLLADPGSGPETLRMVSAWAELIRDARHQYDTYNRPAALLLQNLLCSMEDAG